MRSVVLRKDGFYLRETDTSTRPWSEKPERLLDNGEWLFEWVECLDGIEGKVTLGDVFAILAKLDKGERALFAALAEAGNIVAFIEEAQKPTTEKSDLDYIEIYRFVEISWYKREGVPVFEDNVISSGRCEGDPQRYAFDFTPVNKLLHCEIRLLPTTRFYDFRKDYNENGEFVRPLHDPPFDKQPDDPDYDPNVYPTVNGKPCTCAQCEGEHFSTTYKLGEVLWAIFDDICFHGAPASRDERMDDLMQTVDDYHAGKLETVPLDEVLDRAKKKPSEGT